MNEKGLERRLRIFADWMKDYNEYMDPYTGGVVERAVKYAKEETIQQMGQYLEEILNMTDEQLDKEDEILE